jgi:hypothetical protein
MKGIIRQPGRLLVQIPPRNTSLSVPGWCRNQHPVLCFVDAVYVCRMASGLVESEAFSNLLGGSEAKLSRDLHATLLAGLSIVSIVGGGQNVNQLVKAILDTDMHNLQITPEKTPADWQYLKGLKCSCDSEFLHRPLSPIAAAKAIGIDVWRTREKALVTRVWDLQQDNLKDSIDVREVIFITHRWDDIEVVHTDIVNDNSWTWSTISKRSAKLRRIREALLPYTRYVWMDTLCIDKTNLSELDEAIRSMYRWYANCRAVVLDSGTTLEKWQSRGWCLQEGAAAGALYGLSDGKIVSIQHLATIQEIKICELDLSVYYRPGNDAEILALMDRRETTRIEDMAYALTGIFSIHLTLAYGEQWRARERLLHEIATQKGDLSFLSFSVLKTNAEAYLPAKGQMDFPIAQGTEASTPAIVSHFGITIEVQIVKSEDVDNVLAGLEDLKYCGMKSEEVEGLIQMAKGKEFKKSTTSRVAIFHDVKSVMLIKIHGEDRQTGGGNPIKCCYRLQCCQVEENEFERLFGDIDADFERIWLGNKPLDGQIKQKFRRSQQISSRKDRLSMAAQDIKCIQDTKSEEMDTPSILD